MFWRRKNDGFVWKEYVRTTILVRRQNRRRKVEDIKEAAVDGVKQAGRQGVALGVAGASAAGRGIASGAVVAGRGIATGAVAAYYSVNDAISVASTATSLWLADRLAPLAPILSSGASRLLEAVREPSVSTPLVLIGAIAAVSASARWSTHGFDANAILATAISAIALLLAALPHIADFGPLKRAASRARPEAGSAAGIAALFIAAVAGLSWLIPALTSGTAGLPATSTAAPALTPVSGRIEGKAVAIAGDQLRVGGTLIHLFGVEAPERNQTCSAPGGKSASCGANAKAALQKLMAGKRVNCDVSGRQTGDAANATCQVTGADIAGQLVRSGHVFATTGLFATYASAEREAKTAKAGLWRVGEQLHPADFRAKIWADAKQSAPDGCPIKGIVNGDAKSYLVPWASNYDKAKIRPARGERWFCTEDEARAAGWKPAEPS